ncbi:MAG: hypothetical protein R3B96_25090 [Pirellulaceae bacterium]
MHGGATCWLGFVFDQAARTLGWAIAQVATITAAERFVIGGGVARAIGRAVLGPVHFAAFREYAFGPLRETTQLVPSSMGDDVLLVGMPWPSEKRRRPPSMRPVRGK